MAMIMMARLEPCSVLGEVSIATTAGGHLPESARLQSGEAGPGPAVEDTTADTGQ